MHSYKNRPPRDKSLGMDSEITRRDFLGSSLLASGSVLLSGHSPADILASQAKSSAPTQKDDWTGYGGVGEYASSNGNTWEVVTAGHRMRDNAYDLNPSDVIDTGEIHDCVIVGGGISGLAAALFFQRQAGPQMKCLVLENHPVFGGEAKQNEFEVDGKRLISHQGSAIYFVQYPYSALAAFYDSIGLRAPKLDYQAWSGPDPEMPLARTPYDTTGLDRGQYGFWFGNAAEPTSGVWALDPIRKKFDGAPVPAETRTELFRWFSGQAETSSKFTPSQYEGDAVSRYLDSITLEQHYMERFAVSREFIRTYLSPVAGGGSGLGPDALSAYTDYAANMLHPYEGEGDPVQMFPGGNTTIARLMVKSLIPPAISGEATVSGVTLGKVNFPALDNPSSRARIRLFSTVISVSHDGDPANSSLLTILYAKDGRVFRVKARSAVMAGGSWTTKHVVRDLGAAQKQAYAQFYRSPSLMASVAVRNWRFLYRMGLSGCQWFGGIGNNLEIRKLALTGVSEPTISPDSPVVLTLKILFPYPGLSTEDQGNRGRIELLTTSFREYERRIREQFTLMFGASGFDVQKDIAGIILNRWGHAYLSPQPGFFFGKNGQPAPRDILRAEPFGRIAFANTDLAGAMDHRFSILEAQRAVGQIFDQVLA
ncbi:MAG TPA: NAD(P)-binding protein [Candidatus Acidoferrum sp.]|nr:NAD(P)-binding protein [Candidatus Acidoferrum sp.]